jgi:hypothetical protein
VRLEFRIMEAVYRGRSGRRKIPDPDWCDSLGTLLAKVGLTPPKPLERAYQRDPEVIEKLRCERFYAIATQAKAAGDEVYFWDESGFQADTVPGRPWGKKVQTPVVEGPGQLQSISAASPVNAQGGRWYCTCTSGLTRSCLSLYCGR